MSDIKEKPENCDPLIVVDIVRSFAPPVFKPLLPAGYNPPPIGSLKLSDRTEKFSFDDEPFMLRNPNALRSLVASFSSHFSDRQKGLMTELLRLQRRDPIFLATGNFSELQIGIFQDALPKIPHLVVHDCADEDPDPKATMRHYGGHRYSRYLGYNDPDGNFKAYLKFDESGGYDENESAH